MESENSISINFLDLTIHKMTSKFEFSIYREPSATDNIIPIESFLLYFQKDSSFHTHKRIY